MTQKKPLLQDLSETPGHPAGEELYKVTGPDGRKTHKRAHTAHDAWMAARVELGGPGYNECTFELIPEGVGSKETHVEGASNGHSMPDTLPAALSRIVVLEELVRRKDERIAELKLALESKPAPRRIVLGEQRSKSSPKALEKLIPKKKVKRGTTTRPRTKAKTSKRRVSRRTTAR